MAFKRITIEPDDTEGHALKRGEDLIGQTVTIRLEDGTEVEGHGFKIKSEDFTGDDAEGHGFKRIDLEVDDTAANMLRAATDKGEPVYVRFPDDAEVKGHVWKRAGSDEKLKQAIKVLPDGLEALRAISIQSKS